MGDVTIRLAREFGFCYGVERAVEYAYQTRRKFPDRRIFLVGEIIHNPHVNARLREMGIEILAGSGRRRQTVFDFSGVRPEDVVILPAFGVTIADFETLRGDRVRHGRHDLRLGAQRLEARRELRARRLHGADPRQVLPRGRRARRRRRSSKLSWRRLPRRPRHGRSARVCDYIEGRAARETIPRHASRTRRRPASIRTCTCGGSASRTRRRCSRASRSRSARRSGARWRGATARQYRGSDFRTFDTICSATQDRQDAVQELLEEPLDVMIVIGGFNSSNTISLAALCAERVPTYHIEDATSIDPEAGIDPLSAGG